MLAPGRTEQQASLEALKRFFAKQESVELRGQRFAVLIAEAATGHAGGWRDWKVGHLEPIAFCGRATGLRLPVARFGPPAAEHG